MGTNKAGKGLVHEPAPSLEHKVAALVQLGVVMGHLGRGDAWPGHHCGLSEVEYDELDRAVRDAWLYNGWATEENVRHALGAWSNALATENVQSWVRRYPALGARINVVRTVGLVLAGNVPLVGLHDVLAVWLTGHRGQVKCSSQEPALIPALVGALDRFLPGTADALVIVNGKLGPVDAVIATGSNNTARYFEHYFGHLPRIVRRSRVSVAVLDGSESETELEALGEDVFRYFGLGCRNVSKVYVPEDFDLDRLFRALYPWEEVVNHKKYGNNYDYTRALWLLDGVDFLENGFLLVRETEALASAVATLHVERYTERESVMKELEAKDQEVQCIVGHGAVPFGQAQHPALWDYADGVDTLAFLLGL